MALTRSDGRRNRSGGRVSVARRADEIARPLPVRLLPAAPSMRTAAIAIALVSSMAAACTAADGWIPEDERAPLDPQICPQEIPYLLSECVIDQWREGHRDLQARMDACAADAEDYE